MRRHVMIARADIFPYVLYVAPRSKKKCYSDIIVHWAVRCTSLQNNTLVNSVMFYKLMCKQLLITPLQRAICLVIVEVLDKVPYESSIASILLQLRE